MLRIDNDLVSIYAAGDHVRVQYPDGNVWATAYSHAIFRYDENGDMVNWIEVNTNLAAYFVRGDKFYLYFVGPGHAAIYNNEIPLAVTEGKSLHVISPINTTGYLLWSVQLSQTPTLDLSLEVDEWGNTVMAIDQLGSQEMIDAFGNSPDIDICDFGLVRISPFGAITDIKRFESPGVSECSIRSFSLDPFNNDMYLSCRINNWEDGTGYLDQVYDGSPDDPTWLRIRPDFCNGPGTLQVIPESEQQCIGHTLAFHVSSTIPLNSDNAFIFELDEAGSDFNDPVYIQSVTGNNAEQECLINIPDDISTGYYVYRITTTSPTVISGEFQIYLSDSPENLVTSLQGCHNYPVALTASPGYYYNWSVEEFDYNSNINSIDVIPDSSQLYYCTITDECGPFIHTFNYTSLGAQYDIISAPLPCPGETASVHIQSTPGTTIDVAQAWVTVEDTFTLSADVMTATTINVEISDASGCTYNEEILLDVQHSGIIFDYEGINCPNTPTEVIALAPGTITGLAWETGEGIENISEESVIITSEYDNYYYVTSTGINSGCTYLDSIEVLHYPALSPILSDNSTSLYLTGFENYQWYFNDEPIPLANAYMYHPQENGMYYVVCIDDNGCEVMSNQYSWTASAVENTNEKGVLQVFADKDFIHIIHPGRRISEIVTRNILGQNQEMYEPLNNKGEITTINRSVLAAGIYILTVRTFEGTDIIYKILLE